MATQVKSLSTQKKARKAMSAAPAELRALTRA